MATQKQIQANRANARKSTGPRSVEGKASSSQNALKSGIDARSQIVRGESAADLAALTGQYLSDHRPASAAERALVDILIDCEWSLRRLRKIEAQLWEYEFSNSENLHRIFHPGETVPEDQVLGRGYVSCQTALGRLDRRREVLQRTFRQTLHQLRQIQAERVAAPPATPSTDSPNPEIGFVPQIPLTVPPSTPRPRKPVPIHPVPSAGQPAAPPAPDLPDPSQPCQ